MSLVKLNINKGSYQNLSNSVFEADFLLKVSLKKLNLRIILKPYTHDSVQNFRTWSVL